MSSGCRGAKCGTSEVSDCPNLGTICQVDKENSEEVDKIMAMKLIPKLTCMYVKSPFDMYWPSFEIGPLEGRK